MTPKILYENKDFLIVLKEPGVLVEGEGSCDEVLVRALSLTRKEVYPIHRLDRVVGGLVLFAKNKESARHLSTQIQEHQTFGKVYLAVVEGIPQDEMHVEGYIRQNKRTKKSEPVEAGKGDLAILDFKRIATKENRSLLEVQLVTGRYHQIRCQLSHLGYPIVGDLKYGAKTRGPLGLWSCKLSFLDPSTKKPLNFECLPENAPFDEFK